MQQSGGVAIQQGRSCTKSLGVGAGSLVLDYNMFVRERGAVGKLSNSQGKGGNLSASMKRKGKERKFR